MTELLKRYPELSECRQALNQAREAIIQGFEKGGKILLCGNGGSAADCDHIVGELMKGFMSKRPLRQQDKAQLRQGCPNIPDDMLNKLQRGLPAISLVAATGLNAAFANDVDPKLIYAQSVYALGKPEDVLVAISTSGNAENVFAAAQVAKGLDMTVIALTGENGGKLRTIADVLVNVPEAETYKVQELHLPVYHWLCAQTELYFFEEA